MPKFAGTQTRIKEKADHVPFFWFADRDDHLVFLVIEHPHLRRVLIEHLDLQAGVRHIVMCGQPAAETFQGSKMCITRPVDPFLQKVVDVTVDVFGLDVGGINRGKGRKSADDHSVMVLCTRFITPNVS